MQASLPSSCQVTSAPLRSWGRNCSSLQRQQQRPFTAKDAEDCSATSQTNRFDTPSRTEGLERKRPEMTERARFHLDPDRSRRDDRLSPAHQHDDLRGVAAGPIKKGNGSETTTSPRPFSCPSRLAAAATVPASDRSARSDVSGRFRSHPRFWMLTEAVNCILFGIPRVA